MFAVLTDLLCTSFCPGCINVSDSEFISFQVAAENLNVCCNGGSLTAAQSRPSGQFSVRTSCTWLVVGIPTC